MKFELLPNEMIIECFEYLNGQDIFYSFDRLNSRFDKIIRSVWLHLDFEHVKKSLFDQVCRKMLLNPEMKKQILSLQLSDDRDTCGKIQAFLSLFSLDEFRHLRFLSLTSVKETNIKKLQSMLSSLSNLSCFTLSDTYESDEIFATLPRSKIQNLSILSLNENSINNLRTTSITHLTISRCSWNNLLYMITFVPLLKYFTIESLSYNYGFNNNISYVDNKQSVYLETLIVKNGDVVEYDHFEIVLKHVPNLKSLSVYL